MERDFETVMIEQCSPALAGLKPANLFRHETRDAQALADRVAWWNAQLNPRGIQITVLKACSRTHRYLIYVYREAKLKDIFVKAEVQAFLRRESYTIPKDPASSLGCSALLQQLSRRLCCEGEFPHEIGVFLGYPLEDVVGFIENRGKNFTCCGCWKAYGDPAEAQRRFDQLNKCTAVYLRLFHSGTPILRLAVAA